MAHAPGPWIVGDGGKSLVVWSDSCGLTVAEARRSVDDARLIASAPDLLAALKVADMALDFAQRRSIRSGMPTSCVAGGGRFRRRSTRQKGVRDA
jgi:hypothetical protein